MHEFQGRFRNKTVLVTGHTGFKGSWLVEWLLMLGADVAGFSIDIPTQPANFSILKQDKRILNFKGDVRDLAALKKVFQAVQPQVVFHLAAQALVREGYDQPKATFDVNTGGWVNVLECIRETPSVRAAVLVSTDKCYKNQDWEWGYRENDVLGGSDPYSASKAAAELVFRSYFESFFQRPNHSLIASARAGNVIGGGDWAKDRIIPDCVRAWSKKQEVQLRSPNSVRPWQHVLEPLSGYLQLASQLLGPKGKKTTGEINGSSFNFGPPAQLTQSVLDLVESFQASWSKNVKFRVVKSKDNSKKEHQILKLNCDRANQLLKWNPILNFEETVQMTVNWYREFYQGQADMKTLTRTQIQHFCELARLRSVSWATVPELKNKTEKKKK